MLAVDTNVVVRFLTQDEPIQSARARDIFQRETVLLMKTVMLETEWVLRTLYGFETSLIADAFAALSGLPNVVCEDVGTLADAIIWTRKRMDFADALHLASAARAGRFATLDRALVKRAAELTDIAVVHA
jgi:predicted nucleic-acid-binding protein